MPSATKSSLAGPGYGAFVLSLDFELHWGVRDHEPVNGPYRPNLLGARVAIPRLLELFTRYEIAGGLNRPPMEPSEGSYQLLEKAQRIASELGFKVGAARVGGGSDGNFTAKLAPTLDGFGAFGANAHQKDLEFIHIPSLAPRTALLTSMLMD